MSASKHPQCDCCEKHRPCVYTSFVSYAGDTAACHACRGHKDEDCDDCQDAERDARERDAAAYDEYHGRGK